MLEPLQWRNDGWGKGATWTTPSLPARSRHRDERSRGACVEEQHVHTGRDQPCRLLDRALSVFTIIVLYLLLSLVWLFLLWQCKCFVSSNGARWSWIYTLFSSAIIYKCNTCHIQPGLSWRCRDTYKAYKNIAFARPLVEHLFNEQTT